jgi:gluconolactonase
MKNVLPLFAASLAITFAVPATAAPGDAFPVGATAERVWNAGRFTEGVDVAPDGRVYFSDMSVADGQRPAQTLRFDPRTRQVTVVLSGNGNSNGQKFDAAGNLWSVQMNYRGTRDVRIMSADGQRRVVATGYQGRPFNALNDLAFDASDVAWVTDVRYIGTEQIKQPYNAVYRIDRAGRVTLAISDMRSPNGIAISPDGRTLYVAEHPYRSRNLLEGDLTMLPMSIRAYEITPEGQAVQGRVLVDFGLQEGVDGMTVDANGNIVTAFRDNERCGVRVFSPQGQEIDFLPLPEKPTNVAFGRGAERNVLYVTAGTSLYRVATNTQGARR